VFSSVLAQSARAATGRSAAEGVVLALVAAIRSVLYWPCLHAPARAARL